jgi:hypothetical protein
LRRGEGQKSPQTGKHLDFVTAPEPQAFSRPRVRLVGISHPQEFHHAIGKVNPSVGSALTGMSISRSFLKAQFQQAIGDLGFWLHQHKNVIQF